MAFKTTALAGDRVRETGRHGHIDDAVAVLEPGFPNSPKPWRAESTARPPQPSAVDCSGDVGALIEQTQLIGNGRVQRCRQLLAEYRLIGVGDLAVHAGRDEQPDRPGGKRTKELRVTTGDDSGVATYRLCKQV